MASNSHMRNSHHEFVTRDPNANTVNDRFALTVRFYVRAFFTIVNSTNDKSVQKTRKEALAFLI